jgi:hypothetical protein
LLLLLPPLRPWCLPSLGPTQRCEAHLAMKPKSLKQAKEVQQTSLLLLPPRLPRHRLHDLPRTRRQSQQLLPLHHPARVHQPSTSTRVSWPLQTKRQKGDQVVMVGKEAGQELELGATLSSLLSRDRGRTHGGSLESFSLVERECCWGIWRGIGILSRSERDLQA